MPLKHIGFKQTAFHGGKIGGASQNVNIQIHIHHDQRDQKVGFVERWEGYTMTLSGSWPRDVETTGNTDTHI